jgi:hypothetical protein
VSEAVVDDVVHRNPAPVAHSLEDLFARAERGDDHRHLPFLAGRHVVMTRSFDLWTIWFTA